MKARLHLHSNTGPKTRGYIIADRSGLLELSKLLHQCAVSSAGIEIAKFHNSDGHEYELVITNGVDEDEWQTMPMPYESSSDPSSLQIVQMLDELKREISERRSSKL
jgi:hypothetical protein